MKDISYIGSREWLLDLGFGDLVSMAYFLGSEWSEYRLRASLHEEGLYAIVRASGPIDAIAVAERFHMAQLDPDGVEIAEVPNSSKPGQWRRRWWKADDLNKRWIERADLLYLGKSDPQLKVRLGQLRRFALGGLGHTGGQVLWHIRGYTQRLEIGVLPISRFPAGLPRPPRAAEKRLLAEFRAHYNSLPFANIIN